MPSTKSKIILGLLRNRHLFQFRLRQAPFDPRPEAIEKLRRHTEKMAHAFGKLPQDASIKPETINGRYAEWVIHPESDAGKALLYLHGGMYVTGSPQSHRQHIIKFVMGSKMNALVIDYRLAPEHPFPAGLQDAVASYRFLLESGYKPERIAFAGDSAGAGLVLATLLAIKNEQLPMPAAAAVLSPWTDLKRTGKSYTENIEKCLSPKGSSEHCSELYTAGQDKENPLISPLYGDLKGLPPLHISAGGHEILLSDSISFAEKAQKAGVDVTLVVGEGMCHCYPALGKLFPEAQATLNEICAYLQAHTNN